MGPDRPLGHLHEQSLSVVEAKEHWAAGHSGSMSGLTTTRPVLDSIPDTSAPLTMRKKPCSPQLGPHEFWQIQYGTPLSVPHPTSDTAWRPTSVADADDEYTPLE
jgi:hypothetical protein